MRQRFRAGAVTLIPALSILAVSQQHAMGASPYEMCGRETCREPTSQGDTTERPSNLVNDDLARLIIRINYLRDQCLMESKLLKHIWLPSYRMNSCCLGCTLSYMKCDTQIYVKCKVLVNFKLTAYLCESFLSIVLKSISTVGCGGKLVERQQRLYYRHFPWNSNHLMPLVLQRLWL